MTDPDSKPAGWGWVVSWIFALSFIGVGAWWFKHIPPTGKGGLVLALGATLMPIFWDKAGVIGKAAWIGMLFLLLSVEYRAIDRDREDFALNEYHRRQEEREQFRAVGTAITTNMQRVLDNGNKQFAATAAGLNETIRRSSRIETKASETLSATQATHSLLIALVGQKGGQVASTAAFIGFATELSDTLHRLPGEWEMDVTGLNNLKYTDSINNYLSKQQKESAREKWDAIIEERNANYQSMLRTTVADANLVRGLLMTWVSDETLEDKSEKAFAEGYPASSCHKYPRACSEELSHFADYLVTLAHRAKAASSN
jgi:hypothetical protein